MAIDVISRRTRKAAGQTWRGENGRDGEDHKVAKGMNSSGLD
jgi:hypothetical protein